MTGKRKIKTYAIPEGYVSATKAKRTYTIPTELLENALAEMGFYESKKRVTTTTKHYRRSDGLHIVLTKRRGRKLKQALLNDKRARITVLKIHKDSETHKMEKFKSRSFFAKLDRVIAEERIKMCARRRIKELADRWTQCTRGHFTERDTATNFILPFLESLGWNIYDVYEVKQQGYPSSFRQKLPAESRPLDKPDCVISLNDNPYMVLEFKPLADGGVIDRDERRLEMLQKRARKLNTRYAVLTNFTETIVYGKAEEKPLIRFSRPEGYVSRFDELWEYLSRERAVQWTRERLGRIS